MRRRFTRHFVLALGLLLAACANQPPPMEKLPPVSFADKPPFALNVARLEIVASMQPLHATSDMIIAERYWGSRCSGAYAWKTLLDAGVSLAFGSDCPVESCNPLAGIHAAVTRRRGDGSPGPQGWRPEQKLTVEQAVQAYTLGAAHAAGWEGELGSIETGKRADFTVLDADIFSMKDLHEIRGVKPAAVVVGGRVVFGAL